VYELPFEDDFSDGLGKWTLVQGAWTVEGGLLRCNPSGGPSLICAGSATWEDYTYSARVRSADNSSIGFVLRYGDSGDCYLVAMSKDMTEVRAIRAGAQRLIHRYQRAETYGLEGEVDLSRWHDIRVRVSGEIPVITVEIDGFQEISVKDLTGPQLPCGMVGFRKDADSPLEVDSVSVETMGPKVAGGFSMLILLVEFPDVRHTYEPQEIYDNVFQTLNHFLTEVSYNLTWVVGQVSPRWKMMQKPSTYYDISTVTGSGWTRDAPIEFLRDAIATWDNETDYTKYDYIFVAAAGQSVWGFAIIGADIAQTGDGINITRGSGLREASPWTVYAHELGHIIGLPDLYSFEIAFSGPSDYRVAAVYVGPWDLMSRSDERPQIGAWGKVKLGWILGGRVQECLPGQQLLAILRPLEESPGSQNGSAFTQAIIVWTSTTTYFMVENRQQVGFDAVLPDSGILVSFVDEDRFSLGTGPVVVQDAHPEIGPRWRLPHPVFDIGPGEVDQLVNGTYDIAIVILDKANDSYVIAVCDTSSIGSARSVYETVEEAGALLAVAKGDNYNNSRARSLLASAERCLEEAHEVLAGVGSNIFGEALSKANECVTLLSEAKRVEESNQDPWAWITATALAGGALVLVAILFVRRRNVRAKSFGPHQREGCACESLAPKSNPTHTQLALNHNTRALLPVK
jgi:M6 family metalloprotease-like protein